MVSHLGSNQRLCLGDDRFLGNLALRLGRLRRLGFLGGRSREFGLLGRSNGGRLLRGPGRSRGATATEHLLYLAGVVSSVLLSHGGELISLLLGNASDLGSLGTNCIGGVLKVLVDQLLIGCVDEGDEEGNGGGNDGESPVWDKLDEMVGNEGCNACLWLTLLAPLKSQWFQDEARTYSSRSTDVLNKENSLGLNNEEVDEFMDIANHAINSSP